MCVKRRCTEHKLSDFEFTSLKETPFYKASKDTCRRCCCVRQLVNGKLVQCPAANEGKANEYLCRSHFKTLADWMAAKMQSGGSSLRREQAKVKIFTTTLYEVLLTWTMTKMQHGGTKLSERLTLKLLEVLIIDNVRINCVSLCLLAFSTR